MDELGILTLLLLGILYPLGVPGHNEGKCVWRQEQGHCDNIPIKDIHVPPGVLHVHIHQGDKIDIKSNSFSVAQGWGHVQSLDIIIDTTADVTANIEVGAFNNLSNLTLLGLHIQRMIIQMGAFDGLESLQTLDMSDCNATRLSDISYSVKYAKLPALRNISLSALQTYDISAINIDANLISMIVGYHQERNITNIDLSRLNVQNFDFTVLSMYNLCSTMRSLNFTKTVFFTIINYEIEPTCESLKVLILNDVDFPRLHHFITPENTGFLCKFVSVYFAIEEFYADGMLKNVDMSLNTKMDMRSCPWSIK